MAQLWDVRLGGDRLNLSSTQSPVQVCGWDHGPVSGASNGCVLESVRMAEEVLTEAKFHYREQQMVYESEQMDVLLLQIQSLKEIVAANNTGALELARKAGKFSSALAFFFFHPSPPPVHSC